jgi:autotransporter adhesin
LANARGGAYKGNLGAASDEGTTVEQHLVALDDAIGDRRNYTAQYNIKNNQSVAESLDAMDLRMGDVASLGREMHYYSDPNPASVNLSSAVKSLDSNLYRLEMDHKKLRHETHAGLASAAALSALVPNPRGTGDTTLSFGTGAYQGHTAAAFGGFHWITNNLLVNAGVGWDNREATTRIGVSYSF